MGRQSHSEGGTARAADSCRWGPLAGTAGGRCFSSPFSSPKCKSTPEPLREEPCPRAGKRTESQTLNLQCGSKPPSLWFADPLLYLEPKGRNKEETGSSSQEKATQTYRVWVVRIVGVSTPTDLRNLPQMVQRKGISQRDHLRSGAGGRGSPPSHPR